MTPWGQNEKWAKTGGPDSGQIVGESPDFKYQNPKKGGVYEMEVDLRDKRTKTFLVLPLAGPEISNQVSTDMANAETFISKVNSTYTIVERNRQENGERWFVVGGGGDYSGRPDNKEARTMWKLNQIADYNSDRNAGLGAVVTWFGYPTRLSKLSNFMVAYASRRIGVSDFNAWAAQLYGSINLDPSSTKSWDAGWAVAGGASYQTVGAATARDIWDDQGDKNQKLWPNSAFPDNHVSGDRLAIPDREFCSPGFIENLTP